jgi:signal transduction histidine kinase
MRLAFLLSLLSLGLPVGLRAQPVQPNGLPQGMTDPDSLWAWVHRPGLADTTRVLLLAACAASYADQNLDSALAYSAQAVRLARRSHFSRGLVSGLSVQAASYYYASDYPAAQRSFEQGLRAARAIGNFKEVGHAYLGLGNVAHELHDEPASQAYFAQAQHAYARHTPRYKKGEVLVLYNRVNGYLDTRNAAAARPLLHQAFGLLPSPPPPFAANLWLQLGTIQQLQHQPDSARATWQHAARLAQASHYLQAEATARQHLAELAEQQHQYPLALAHAQNATRLFRTLGDPERLADALRTQAAALAALHRPGAYDTLLRYTALLDTVFNQQRLEAVATAQARFSQAEQQARIRALEQQQRIVRLEAAQRSFRSQVLLAALALAALLLAGLGTWAYRRRQAARDAALRTRLAADLHDDVGGLLTQISLESALLEEGSYAPAQQQARLHRVAEASRTAARQMRDVVWSVDARNDSFASLLDQMHEYAHEVLAPTGTELSFETDPTLKTRPLRPLARQSLYLIFKEALHNVAKHAQASEVHVRLALTAAGLRLEVRDNGQGSPGAAPAASHGLRNMRMRAEAVGGTVQYDTAGPGFGVVAVLPG